MIFGAYYVSGGLHQKISLHPHNDHFLSCSRRNGSTQQSRLVQGCRVGQGKSWDRTPACLASPPCLIYRLPDLVVTWSALSGVEAYSLLQKRSSSSDPTPRQGDRLGDLPGILPSPEALSRSLIPGPSASRWLSRRPVSPCEL